MHLKELEFQLKGNLDTESFLNKLYSQKRDLLIELKKNYTELDRVLAFLDGESSFPIVYKNENIISKLQDCDQLLSGFPSDMLPEFQLRKEVRELLEACIILHNKTAPLLEKVKENLRNEINQFSIQRQLKEYLNDK